MKRAGALAGSRVLVAEDGFLIVDDLAHAFGAFGAEVVGPVTDALRDRGVPFVFATGYDAHAVPPRSAQVRRRGKPLDPRLVVEALGDRVAASARVRQRVRPAPRPRGRCA